MIVTLLALLMFGVLVFTNLRMILTLLLVGAVVLLFGLFVQAVTRIVWGL